MDDDRRRDTRVLTFKTGMIVSEPHGVRLPAAVLDISEGGACLLVSDVDEVPDRFRLYFDCKPQVHDCEVRWKYGHKIGICFRGEPTLGVAGAIQSAPAESAAPSIPLR